MIDLDALLNDQAALAGLVAELRRDARTDHGNWETDAIVRERVALEALTLIEKLQTCWQGDYAFLLANRDDWIVTYQREHAEVERLARGHDEYNRVNRLLTIENEALREVLAWYADTANWQGRRERHWDYPSRAVEDSGKKARAVMEPRRETL